MKKNAADKLYRLENGLPLSMDETGAYNVVGP